MVLVTNECEVASSVRALLREIFNSAATRTAKRKKKAEREENIVDIINASYLPTGDCSSTC